MDLYLSADYSEQKEAFWDELLGTSAIYNTVFTRRRARRIGYDDSKDLFTLVRVGLFDQLQFFDSQWAYLTKNSLRPLLSCIVLPPLHLEAMVIDKTFGHCWLVLQQDGDSDIEEHLLRYNELYRNISRRIECCWLTGCGIADLRGAADRLRIISNDIGTGKGLFVNAEHYTLSCGYRSDDYVSLWELLVDKGYDAFIEAVQKKIESFIDPRKSNLALMMMLRADTERLLRKALEAKQLDHSDIEDARCMDLLSKAHYNATNLMEYIKAALKPLRSRFPADVVYPEPVQKIIRYLDENPEKPYTRSVLGEVAGLNPNYLASLFKETTGQSVSTYRGLRQMELAASMLAETRLSISEISEKAGFGDQTYFSNAFRKQFGISPGEYRKRNKK